MPWFTWHGFRYFELTNNAEPVRCEVVHSDCAVTSSFESDSEMLNWLYDAYIRTQLSNMHSGVPSDCPHIERLGYTGDGQLCCEAAMMLWIRRNSIKSGSKISPTARASETVTSSTPRLSWAAAEAPQAGAVR